MKLLSLIVLGAIAQLAVSDVAKSQVTVNKDLELGILITGLAPNSTNEVVFSGTRITKNVYSNVCSFLVLRNNQNDPLPRFFTVSNVGGKTDELETSAGTKQIDQVQIPPGEMTCRDGIRSPNNLFNIPFLKNARGDIFIRSVANNDYLLEYQGRRTRRVAADTCGIGKIKYTSNLRTEGEVIVNGQTFNPTDDRNFPPICVKGNLYIRSSF